MREQIDNWINNNPDKYPFINYNDFTCECGFELNLWKPYYVGKTYGIKCMANGCGKSWSIGDFKDYSEYYKFDHGKR